KLGRGGRGNQAKAAGHEADSCVHGNPSGYQKSFHKAVYVQALMNRATGRARGRSAIVAGVAAAVEPVGRLVRKERGRNGWGIAWKGAAMSERDALAEAAVEGIEGGMIVGLGTGRA